MPESRPKKLESLMEQFVTVRESAELRGVSRASIHALIKRERLMAVAVFGRVLLYRREVERIREGKARAENPGRPINSLRPD